MTQKTGRIKMDSRTLRTWKLIALWVLFPSAAPLLSEPLIVNYDNNANLQKAMEYDLTMNNMRFVKPGGEVDMDLYHSYVAKASRELAEKHYLAYLEEVKEPFQRARVYAKLSDLYSGHIRQEVAPHPTPQDMEKALEYCRKALAEAPEGVSLATVHIRGKLAMLPDREKGFYALEDYYQWLLSLDEQKITKNWLPLRPGDNRPGKPAVDGLLQFLDDYDDTMAHNLVDLAVNLGRAKTRKPSPDKEHLPEYDPCYLLEIIRRFPGTKAQEYANKEVAKLNFIIVEEHVELVSPVARGTESASRKMERLPAPSPSQEKTEEAIPTPLAVTANANSAREGSFVPYLLAGGVLALTVVAFLAVKGLQGRKKPESL
jgi:tetratricopeptide (TPR) repeat protein